MPTGKVLGPKHLKQHPCKTASLFPKYSISTAPRGEIHLKTQSCARSVHSLCTDRAGEFRRLFPRLTTSSPALPIPALAKAAPGATMAKDSMYIWANVISRVHNKCSPAMLTRLLHIEPAHGAQLYTQLMADGAITAPNAYGLSQSTDPLYQNFASVPGHGPKSVGDINKPNKDKVLESVKADEDPAEVPDEHNVDEHIELEEDNEGVAEKAQTDPKCTGRSDNVFASFEAIWNRQRRS